MLHTKGSVDEIFMPLPEHPAPSGIDISCETFGLDGHNTRLVWGEGDPRAPVMVILDNPGAREDPSGTPYVCGTRQTLRTAARAGGLDRDGLYVTFLIKCRPRKKYDKARARRTGLKYIIHQIQTQRPKILLLLGDVVTQTVTGQESTSVRKLRNQDLTVWETPAVVSYHPLAARRRPNLYPLLASDTARAAAMIAAYP